MRSSQLVSTGFFYLAAALVFAASFALPVSADVTGGGGGGPPLFCPEGRDCTTSCNGGNAPNPCTGWCGFIYSNCGCFANNSNSGPTTCSCSCN
jgi:hypothetical protein